MKVTYRANGESDRDLRRGANQLIDAGICAAVAEPPKKEPAKKEPKKSDKPTKVEPMTTEDMPVVPTKRRRETLRP
jgi:hypothetical protein